MSYYGINQLWLGHRSTVIKCLRVVGEGMLTTRPKGGSLERNLMFKFLEPTKTVLSFESNV